MFATTPKSISDKLHPSVVKLIRPQNRFMYEFYQYVELSLVIA